MAECPGHEPSGHVTQYLQSDFPYEGHLAQFVQLGYRLQLVTSGRYPQLAPDKIRQNVPKSNGVPKVREREDVPGAASQRTCLEGAEVEGGVAGEVGEDHFYNVIRDATGRCVRGTRFWRRGVEETIDTGFASKPDGQHAGREVHPYNTNGRGQNYCV